MTAAASNRDFEHLAPTQQEEDAYDYVQHRSGIEPVHSPASQAPSINGDGEEPRMKKGKIFLAAIVVAAMAYRLCCRMIGSISHIIKGALGAGILSGHVAYMHGGVVTAVVLNILAGILMGVCLYLLVWSMQVLLRRTKRPFLSYADAGEAALKLFPKPGLQKFHAAFRYFIDFAIILDLFGACCCYQLIIAKSAKQLVENTAATPKMAGLYPGYPSLRVYVLLFLPVMMMICSIRQLKYLAPFSIVANIVLVFCIILTIYYCFQNNPTLSGMRSFTSFQGTFQYLGMQVFSMSCCGLVIPIESNMKDPRQFKTVLSIGMFFIIICTMLTSFFGYAAYLDESTAPITVNFPMTTVPKLFKLTIMLMVLITHGLNFWAPFNLVWYYLKSQHDQDRIVMWERIWRIFFTAVIATVAIVFPAIAVLMGFLGSVCIVNMAFLFPCVIYLLTVYERPGYGKYKWRLITTIFYIICAVIVLLCGTYTNAGKMVDVLTGNI